jgi:hypothetical protein
MHGRNRIILGVILLLALAGCTDDPQTETSHDAAPVLTAAGPAFDSASTGTIEGQVTWQGPDPAVDPLLVLPDPENPAPDGKRLYKTPNPFCPLIDTESRGMRDVVVYLRAVDPERACPWPHGRALVEQKDRMLTVLQDGTRSRVGFVRRGDEMEAVNQDPEYHSLRARGAACFCLPFVEKGRISRKRLGSAGTVDLTSGAGHFWMCAHLFVVEHPYYARTDAQGRFRLQGVPPGGYELVCWMPSWVVLEKYRDPESALTSRLVFAPPVERVMAVAVVAGRVSTTPFAWTASQVPGAK